MLVLTSLPSLWSFVSDHYHFYSNGHDRAHVCGQVCDRIQYNANSYDLTHLYGHACTHEYVCVRARDHAFVHVCGRDHDYAHNRIYVYYPSSGLLEYSFSVFRSRQGDRDPHDHCRSSQVQPLGGISQPE